ncbi:hypothetical protein GMORB2_7386 [Geosmithia morbida]|uniref:Wax synthase domain-containing protein n=1 Tax=Geosmithia morbida TaxID=1094350 RepID=A0A9P4YV69_9HYPO|nr:uncharacterized protein GMORB2_7386 [Geosmithia morbida]KAF4122394.1 hypothetical protein GMORB2_7386 [Geosmithia morbida]
MSDFKNVPLEHLADFVRAKYRAEFTQAVADGRSLPFTLPYGILGAFIVPTLWLAIPHLHSQWMRGMQWLVVAFVIVFNIHVAQDVSSSNMAFAYASGLMAGWGTLSTMNILVWNDAQKDAARIMRRPKVAKADRNDGDRHAFNVSSAQDQLRHRKHDTATSRKAETAQVATQVEYEYVWQPFPIDGTFLERLNWAFDLMTDLRFDSLMTNFNLAGWNWAPSILPRPKVPSSNGIPYGTPVDIASIPVSTESGYRLCATESEFLWGRIGTIATMYIILDFLAVTMTSDPYFIVGSEYASLMNLDNLPHYLKRDDELQPFEQYLMLEALYVYRQVSCVVAVAAAISLFLNINDLFQYYVFSYFFPSRGELWQQPPTFGSITPTFVRGLAGLWGSTWHQSFRVPFAAPAKWLLRRGYIKKGTPVAGLTLLLVSFMQSGLLHASGSASSMGPGSIWRTPIFFMLQALGIIIQVGGSFALPKYLPSAIRPSHDACYAINFVFQMLWLHATGSLFTMDLSDAGLWLLEPVPFSFFRMVGYGFPHDNWWRWDGHYMPRWYTAKNWWQSGIAL